MDYGYGAGAYDIGYGCPYLAECANNYDPNGVFDESENTDDPCEYGDVVVAGPAPLFFSEYAEGSSNNKYLEIYNPTNEVVDLSGYALQVLQMLQTHQNMSTGILLMKVLQLLQVVFIL